MATPTIAEELAAAESLLTAANEKITALSADLAVKGAQIGSLTAELATAKDQHAQVVAALEQKAKDAVDAHAKTSAELANAKEIMANPAFAKAAAVGSTPPPVGGDAAVTKSRAEWLADYNKLTSPKDREAFRKAHKAELGLK
jgi:septal ring factor EnvC (AmiA/AmiB activator)